MHASCTIHLLSVLRCGKNARFPRFMLNALQKAHSHTGPPCSTDHRAHAPPSIFHLLYAHEHLFCDVKRFIAPTASLHLPHETRGAHTPSHLLNASQNTAREVVCCVTCTTGRIHLFSSLAFPVLACHIHREAESLHLHANAQSGRHSVLHDVTTSLTLWMCELCPPCAVRRATSRTLRSPPASPATPLRSSTLQPPRS